MVDYIAQEQKIRVYQMWRKEVGDLITFLSKPPQIFECVTQKKKSLFIIEIRKRVDIYKVCYNVFTNILQLITTIFSDELQLGKGHS